MKFNNKVAVVTGAGGGVGRQLVLGLLERGATVAAVDINKSALAETKMKAGNKAERVFLYEADITNKERVFSLAKEVAGDLGQVDLLINNAGIIQDFITLADLSESASERLMNINYYGMMHMTRAFLPYLADRPEAHIGNVSSMGGFLPVPGQAVYGASKAAVKIATEGLRMELSKTNIGVSLIIPGGIETDIKKNSGIKDAEITEEDKKSAGIKLTTPEDAAKIILKGIEKNKGKILVGSDCKMMDFLYRVMPERAGKIIGKVMADNHGGIMNNSEDLKRNLNRAS